MEHLKELRTQHNLTQQMMAEYLGVDRTTYVKYETGKSEPTFDTLQRLANYFKVSTDYLLGHDSLPSASKQTRQSPSVDDIKFALFGDAQVSDADLEDVKRYAEFVMNKRKAAPPSGE